MKTMFTLIAALLITAVSFATDSKTKITVTSLSNAPIRVMVDGQWMPNDDETFVINNLRPGYHRIQIYSGNRYNKNRRDRDRGRGTNWDDNRNDGNLIYNSTIKLRRGMRTDIIINRYGKGFVDEQYMNDRYDDDWNDRPRNGNGNRGWNNNGGRNNQFQQMDAATFQQLKRSVQREAFDDHKITIIKSVFTNSAVSAAQVKELMQQISFEQNKLELAKYAYRYTTDRSNYFILNDVFSFSNSKKDLSDYILNYRD